MTISVEVARDTASLRRIVPAWETLAAHALEPNPLYEHWMLLPALEAEPNRDLRCVLVWVGEQGKVKLGALFPLRRVTRFKGLPASALSSWRHRSWLLGTPLFSTGDTIREFHDLPGVRWMDSITEPDNITINRLWKDRCMTQTLVVGVGGWGEMWSAMLPMLGWAKRRWDRARQVETTDNLFEGAGDVTCTMS